MKHTRPIALAAALAAGLTPLAAAPSTAQTPATSTTYTAAPSATYAYRAPGVTATITITRQADVLYRVAISGTSTSAGPIRIPASSSSGLFVPVRQQRMASGHGGMNLTGNAAVFAFDKAYLASYAGPFTFSGWWDEVVVSGQTGTQTITVGGHAYPIGIKAPDASVGADGKGQRIMERHIVEADLATLKNQAVTNRYFAADNDRKLYKTELKDLYTKSAYRPYFAESYRFLAVDIPKNATDAEKLAAVNAKLPHGWPKLTSTQPTVPTKNRITKTNPVVVTTVWDLNTAQGAKPIAGGAAFGPRGNLPEFYIGTSNHR